MTKRFDLKPAAALLLGCALGAARPARAAVAFTGYADLDYIPWSNTALSGNPASLGALGNPASGVGRTFQTPSLGLFAATEVRDDLQFLMDVTYHSIGYQVGSVQIQYAYLEYKPLDETTLKAGRILLPFGYYNENYFYPFQRYAINSPVFQSAMFGLPMADWGGEAEQKFELPWFTTEIAAYMVNGFGNVPASSCPAGVASCANYLRLPSLPNSGTSIVSDQGSSASNNQPALGARLRLMDIGGAPVETGFSYYYHNWNAGGSEPMRLMDAHLRYEDHGLRLLVEGLQIDVLGDQGFAPAIGSPDWETRGWLGTGSYNVGTLGNVPVILWLQGEQYRTRPLNGGFSIGNEEMNSLSGGVDFQLTDAVRLKTQVRRIYYRLPMTEFGDNVREQWDQVSMAVVVTF